MAAVGVPPTVRVVAAPKMLPVRMLVLKTEPVAVLEDTILGEAPLMFNTVAFERVTVALAIVVVPVAAPSVKVVAAPAKFTVVESVFQRATVVLLFAVRIVGKLRLKVPRIADATALPMFTLVVEPEAPAVPMFTVFVVALATAPVERLVVEAAVLEYPTVKVVVALKAVSVVATVSNTENVLEPVTILVVILGDVIVCTPVNVFAASVRATVKFASGNVTVRAAVGPANVTCCPKIGRVLEAFGRVTTVAVPAIAAG